MMFVSTASGFCDETNDALEPAVSHLHIAGKIQETSTKNVSVLAPSRMLNSDTAMALWLLLC